MQPCHMWRNSRNKARIGMGARTYEGIQSAKHLLFLVLIPEPPASTNEDSLRILDIGRVLSQG